MISRRQYLLAGASATLGACARKRGTGYAGYAFVANEEGKAVAAVDLTAFAVAKHIRLPGAPTALISDPGRKAVYALTPSQGSLHEIDTDKLAIRRSLPLKTAVLGMRPEPGGNAIWIASSGTRRLLRVDLERFTADASIRLPAEPTDFDISNETGLAGVSFGASGQVGLFELATGRRTNSFTLNGEAGLVRFRKDGKAFIAANTSGREITLIDTSSGRIIVHLPVAVRPDQFCFHPDGGQLFITGEGRDVVVVVYPYYVPEVAETVLAGSHPGPMAATEQHLFVTNPAAGDVTIMNIVRRRVIAVASVGRDPGFVAMTPDGAYALVLNRSSGDMAVIRVAGLQPDRRKSAPLFTMIPVGSKPVSAVVAAVA